jgi:2-polyprenyl-3-methyl-5-hydroxy-6-metoxy-1,4-benzoquinol methylase
MTVPHSATLLASERARVAELTPDFSSEDGFNARLIDFRFESLLPVLDGVATVLELGCSDGRMTERLAAAVPSVTAVDGSRPYVEAVRRRLPGVEVVHALFEEYEPGGTFDVVILGHVLEHVAEPVALLDRARGFLAGNGRMVVSVPNADSLHRHAGVAMGMLGSVTELNEADLRIGHRRVYTRDALVADVRAAGLEPEQVGGVFLKPVSNGQIEEHWPEELIRAYYELGKKHPELCADLMVVARHG